MADSHPFTSCFIVHILKPQPRTDTQVACVTGASGSVLHTLTGTVVAGLIRWQLVIFDTSDGDQQFSRFLSEHVQAMASPLPSMLRALMQAHVITIFSK